jgi:hypothetical protein
VTRTGPGADGVQAVAPGLAAGRRPAGPDAAAGRRPAGPDLGADALDVAAGARADTLDVAAGAWLRVSAQVRACGAGIDVAGEEALSHWAGASAAAFRAHRGALAAQVAAAATAAAEAGGALADVAAALRRATTHPAYPSRTAAARALTDALAAARATVVVAAARLEAVVRWCATVTTGGDGFARRLPDEPELAGGVAVADDVVVVCGTDRDDTVEVARDPATGGLVITVDGVGRRVAAGARAVVRTGSGADVVAVRPDVDVPVTVLAGAGDDRVTGGGAADLVAGLGGDDDLRGGGGDDTVHGGDGRDYVDGGDARDTLRGGAGDDTLYGLGGDDRLDGGAGVDYADGGRGDDTLRGGSGGDALTGGRGRDDLGGGAGDDRLYGGDDRDTLAGGAGTDVAYAQPGDARTGTERDVTVALPDDRGLPWRAGSAGFAARVDSDLDALRSSPTGVRMLDALARAPGSHAGAAPVGIAETADANGYAVARSGPVGGVGVVTVRINPGFQEISDGPPVTVLFHELAHAYDALYGTAATGVYPGADNPGAPNSERAVVGLPVSDGDPAGASETAARHPAALTENALRAELGVPPRERY